MNRSLMWLALILSVLFIAGVCLSVKSHAYAKPDPMPPSSVSPKELRLAQIRPELEVLQKKLEIIDTSAKLSKENPIKWCSNMANLYELTDKQLKLIKELEALGSGSAAITIWKKTILLTLSTKDKFEKDCERYKSGDQKQ